MEEIDDDEDLPRNVAPTNGSLIELSDGSYDDGDDNQSHGNEEGEEGEESAEMELGQLCHDILTLC